MIADDQQQVHSPFVPSGVRSPCASVDRNQGFPTAPGGCTVPTKPDIRFSPRQFHKQQPLHEKAVTSLTATTNAWLYDVTSNRGENSLHYQPYRR